MKRLMTILASLALLGQTVSLFADYIMVCDRFGGNQIYVYKMDDDGKLTSDYTVEVDGNTESLCFAPNGRWGMAGSHTTDAAWTQKTIILDVDDNQKISHLGSVHCNAGYLVGITPDSKYGVYGWHLCTVEHLSANAYQPLNCWDEWLGDRHAPFSSMNGNMLTCYLSEIDNKNSSDAKYLKWEIVEYTLTDDGKTTVTGERLQINPSTGGQDIDISTDGKTCVLISGATYQITVLRLHEKGGFTMTQQFDTDSLNASQVVFSPDSKYAIVSFQESSYKRPALRCYSIDDSSRLMEVSVEYLTDYPGEDLAITPDGKYVVTRYLNTQGTTFNIIRLHDDGTLEYLPEKDYLSEGGVSAIAFLPEPQPTGWVLY